MHVVEISETNIYDNDGNVLDAITRMKNTYGGNNWANQDANIHHAILGRNLMGGTAEASSLCNTQYGFSVTSEVGTFTADQIGGYISGPVYWDMYILAHELGHNFGAPHAHEMPVSCLRSSFGPTAAPRATLF